MLNTIMGKCSLIAVACSLSLSAFAVADTREMLDVPAGELITALKELARQSDVELLYQPEQLINLQTDGVQGVYSPQEAIGILLKGTALRLHSVGGGAMVIAPASSAESITGALSLLGKMRVAQAAPARPAQPAVADTSSSDLGLEEVIVTAERRQASIQDVAMSARALTGEELQRLGATSVEEYATLVPGLNLIQAGGPGRTQIEMRGVSIGGMRDDRPEFGPTVGIYLDESPIAAQTVNANVALMDLERIEVMRGPQATLYGAGSLSGTVRMITRKPDLNRFSGKLAAGTSHTEQGEESYDVSGIANVPLVPAELALRAGGFYREEGGFLDNIVLGTNDDNDTREVGGRLALRYAPTDDFRLDATFGYQESGIDSSFQYVQEAGDLNTQFALPTPLDSELTVASLVAEKEFGAGTLTSASSYFGNDSLFDGEVSRFSRVATGADFNGPPEPDDFLAVVKTFFELSEFTQEFRFVSNDEGRLSWIGGVLFQRKEHSFGQDLPIPGIDAAGGIDSTDYEAEPDNLFKSRVESRTTQYSVFGEATAKVTDRLTLKAGLRWFDVQQDSTTFFGGLFSVPNVGTAPAEHSGSDINPTFNVSYDIDDDRMVYLQAARGFRLGGTNEPVPADLCAADLADAGFAVAPESFDSDTLWNYEAGLKSSWLNNRLRVNVAGYVIDWQDPPYPIGLPCGFSTIINAGEYDISGIELDVEGALARGLVSRFGFSYTDSTLGEDVPVVGGKKGDRAPLTPELTASASLDYDFPVTQLGGLMAFVHVDVRWVDARPNSFRSVANGINFFELPAYTEGNLRGGLYSDAWRVEAFIANLWDERPVFSKGRNTSMQFPGTVIMTSRPRTYGVQVTREF